MTDRLPNLIAVTGKARHGKGSVASVLVEAGYTEVMFSTGVKELALRINPVIDDTRLATAVDVVGWEGAKRRPEVRRILQAIGNEVREIIGKNAWVDALHRTLDFTTPVRYVISDLRYVNEAVWVQRMGGEVWRVERPANFNSGLSPEQQAHPSEAEVDLLYADLFITNDGTLEALQAKVRRYIQGRA
jgi:dephospho-CoA kinase